ncbi:RecBCD enzyme subunit RecC [compost metagenome]
MCEPLPVGCKTAFAWLSGIGGAALDQARETFEGGYMVTGEVASSAALRRAYPDFDALSGDGRFTLLAEHLYGPLFNHLSSAGAGSDL